MDKTRELLLAELNDLRACNVALGQYKARAEQLEADLRKNEEMTRRLLEQKLYGVWVNVGDKVAYINEAGADILGAKDPGEVVGKPLSEIIHPDYHSIVRDRINAMSHGDSAVPMIEEKYVRVDGQAVDVDVWAMRFIYKGEPAFLVAFKDITGRKRAEEAMKLTQFALDNFGDSAIWLTLDGSIVYVNHETCRGLGYSREELLSMHIWDLDPDYTMQKFSELWPETRQHGDFLKFESRHIARDGRVFPVEVTSCYTRYGDKEYLITFDRDITERKRADRALRESEVKYRDLVENANSIIIRWDLKGDLTFINEFAEKFFGYPASEVLGKNVVGTIVPAAESTGRDLTAMIRDIERHPEHYTTNINENIRRNGELVWISWTNKAIRDKDGKVVEILSVGNDITARKRAEEALKAAKAQAELYLDLMGHDINNMHQIALGYLEMARDMPPGPVKDEMIEKPIEVLQRSTQLIKNVRKLQKLSDGLFLDSVIDVAELLSGVQREFGSIPGKVVSLNLNGCKHCRVRANELLHDVFSNLVGNAIKHTGDRADILVDLDVVNYKGGRYCQVSIEDNGRGIPDDFKARIFHRGLKGKNKAKGMGLGLYLVKSLVESYDGNVRVEDRVPGDYKKGAKFVVMLPIVEK